MAHPFLNRQVKTSLRWYADGRLRTRSTVQCKPHSECIFAMDLPPGVIIPFQALVPNGGAPVTSWKVYDLNENEVLDLSAHIGELTVGEYADPPRAIIMLEDELYIDDLPTGKHEMVIGCATGVVYSETVNWLRCESEDTVISSPNPALSTDNWYQGDYYGTVDGVVDANGDLPAEPDGGATYVVLDDDLLYTWNGASYDTSTPGDGEVYSPGIGVYYSYSAMAGFSLIPLGNDSPIYIDSESTCWRGHEPIPLIYQIGNDLPASPFGMQLVHLDVLFFYGSGIAGSLEIRVDGDLVATINNASPSSSVDFFAGEDSEISFNPTADFTGCLQEFEVKTLGGDMSCYHHLKWRNCGDIGTVKYEGNEYWNHLFLKNDKADITDPTPIFKLEPETDANGGDVKVRARKDVDWTLAVADLPWYLVDALTEAVACDDVRLRVPFATDEDNIEDLRFAVEWPDKCLAKLDMQFKVDEETVADNCCGEFDSLCSGAGYMTFVVDGQAALFNLISTSGYFSVRHPDGTVTTHGTGLTEFDGDGTYCAWSSDRLGNLRFDALRVDFDPSAGLVSINVSEMARLEEFYVLDCPNLTCAVIDGLTRLFYLEVTGCALSEACVDAIFNAMPTSNPTQSIFASTLGGTSAAPTAASATNRTAITAGGGMVNHN